MGQRTNSDAAGEKRHRPNPYRRAIANAILLEQAWDRLATFSQCGPPPFDRIVPEGARRDRRLRMVLPKPLNDVALRSLHDERLEAVRTLHGTLAPTLNPSESFSIDALLDESVNLQAAEQYHVVARRRHVRTVGDMPDVVDDQAAAIAKEADRPLSPPVERKEKVAGSVGLPARPKNAYDRDSISIDLLVHSLIVSSRVDRSALHREIAEIRRSLPNPHAVIDVHSPSRRSNTGRTLRSLGSAFPPASLRMVGASLDAIRIDIETTGRGGTSWRYAMTTGRHAFTTKQRPEGMKIWDLPGRTLSVATGDAAWHPNIIVETAVDGVSRSGTNSGGVIMTLAAGRTHIDPPGSPQPVIYATHDSRIAAPLNESRTDRWRHLDAAPLIEATLLRLGQTQQRRIALVDGQGLVLRIAAPNGSVLSHRFPISAETIDDGRESIVARVEDIVSKILSQSARKGLRRMNEEMPSSGASVRTTVPVSPTKTETVPIPPDPMQLLGADGVARLEACGRIDVLLSDVLKDDPIGTAPELHVQEGILCVSSATIAQGVRYRLERFDRTMGRVTHAIATVELDRSLSASMVERLRDGAIGLVVPTWPNFARSIVRKVSRDEISTIVTIRVPIVEMGERS